jgi:uncharacterized protein YjbI with pentapeptide repeats
MASDGKNNEDGGPALGWDLFRLKWVAEPPVGLAASLYGVLFIIFLLIASSGVVALWQLLVPIWTGALPTPISAGTDPGAELRGRLLVIGALLTTPFLIWRLIVGHWAARAAQAQARIAQETTRNTLFTKAIEQLGAVREEKTAVTTRDANGLVTSSTEQSAFRSNTEVRLGAIYALEKLARDDLDMHWPIMETLCAYVRENAGVANHPSDEAIAVFSDDYFSLDSNQQEIRDRFKRDCGRPSVDVQASISVIGRRTSSQKDYETRRREDPNTNVKNAWRLDLRSCNLSNINFSGLDFNEALFNDSSLNFCNFEKSSLNNSSFISASAIETRYNNTIITGTRFHGTHLEQAYFGRAKINEASFTSSKMAHAKFLEAEIRESKFGWADLIEAQFDKSKIKNVDFMRARLAGASFDGTTIAGGTARRCNLEGASFVEATIQGMNLDAAVFTDSRLDEANLSEAIGISKNQFDSAWGNSHTVLPAACQVPETPRWQRTEPDSAESKNREIEWNDAKSQRIEEARKKKRNYPY